MKCYSKRLISLFILTIMVLSIFIPNIALAIENKPILNLTVNNTDVQRGEELIASVNFNNNGNTQCSGISFKVDYNPDVLEFVNAEQILSTGSVTINGGTAGQVSFVFFNTSGLIYNASLFKIHFKVKDTAASGTSGFSITRLGASEIIEDDGPTGVVVIEPSIITDNFRVHVPVESISLSETAVTLKETETTKLDVTYSPTDATPPTITWTTSDGSIATVDATGNITALSRGSATITATTDNGKTASCDVTVQREIGSVVLDRSAVTLDRNETTKLVASIPDDSDGDKTITWTSSDDSVATVASDGTVTAVSKGTAMITATTSNGKKAICNVTVSIKLQSIAFKDGITEKDLKIGETGGESFDLEVIYTPTDTDVDKSTLTWQSTDTSIATVVNGKVQAISSGDVVITARIGEASATCNIHVTVPILSIAVKPDTELTFGQEETLIVSYITYNLMPTTDDKTIDWSSSDESIAKVSTNGTITTVAPGTATITAKSVANAAITASCEVTVKPVPLTSIVIEQQGIVLEKGETTALTVKYNPDQTTDSKDITWTSSDSSIAVVDRNGVVAGLKNGRATITATTSKGLTSTTNITVVTTLKDIKLNETDVTINKDVPLKLTVTLDPIDATLDDPTIVWRSSNTDVARVNSTGDVTTLKAGTTYITASVGGKQKQCKVTVNVPLTAIKMETNVTILKGQEKILTVTKEPDGTNFSGDITFDSSETKYATVNRDGKIQGISATPAGTPVTITANAVENGVIVATTTCEVTVIEIPLDTIAINQADFSLGIGRTQQLKVLYNPPSTTDDKTVLWTTSNSAAVTVDSNGLVKAVGTGDAVITAICNGKMAEVVITGYEIPISKIRVYTNLSNNRMAVGTGITLTIKVEPADATKQGNYRFTSSDERILTVNNKGDIIAHAVGKTLVTVETENGIKEQVEIEVVKDTAAAAEEYKRLSPKTGDIKVELYTAVMLASAFGLLVILITSRKKRR